VGLAGNVKSPRERASSVAKFTEEPNHDINCPDALTHFLAPFVHSLAGLPGALRIADSPGKPIECLLELASAFGLSGARTGWSIGVSQVASNYSHVRNSSSLRTLPIFRVLKEPTV
jgi:hypothetical protein